MTITINNKSEIMPHDHMSVQEVLDYKCYNWALLIVKCNGEYLKRTAYHSTQVNEGDDLMILNLVPGG